MRLKFLIPLVGVTIYLGAITYAALSKDTDERATAMLSGMRTQLARQGVSSPHENVGLEFGRYSGCRVLLLEHLFADGCLGLRIENQIRPQASPEMIRQVIQQTCSMGDTLNCKYRGDLVVSIRYFQIARTYQSDNSTTVIREPTGESFHYWVPLGTS